MKTQRTCSPFQGLLVAAFSALLSLSCTPAETTVPPPGRTPQMHRPAATTCSATRPPGVTMGTGGRGDCMTDADCTDMTKGKNGRCVFSRAGTICTYDTCADDSTCGGKVCLCRDPAEKMASTSTNHCLSEGNCRTDADCGGASCSPSFGSCGSYSGVIAYYCHTSKDSCVDDADCAVDGGLPGYCAFNPAAGSWQCSTSLCVG